MRFDGKAEVLYAVFGLTVEEAKETERLLLIWNKTLKHISEVMGMVDAQPWTDERKWFACLWYGRLTSVIQPKVRPDPALKRDGLRDLFRQ